MNNSSPGTKCSLRKIGATVLNDQTPLVNAQQDFIKTISNIKFQIETPQNGCKEGGTKRERWAEREMEENYTKIDV